MAGRALSSSRELQRTVGSIANGPLFSRDPHSMQMKPDQRFQFVFKPTTACNLACKYCYAAKDRLEGKSCVIGLSEAKKAFDWAARFCHEFNVRSVSVLWHGGEPLLLGAAFLDEVASYYKTLFASMSISCHSRIQTNLLLFNDKIGSVIMRHFDGVIGFSYDWNVVSRIFPNGRDASGDIWKRAISLKQSGFKVGAITQLAPTNIHDIPGLYKHFSDAGISFKLSQVFPSENGLDTNEFSLDPETAAEGACQLFDLWLNDVPQRIYVEPFRDMIQSILVGESEECSRRQACSPLLLTLLPDGRIFPCTRYCFSKHEIGNWKTDSPRSVLARRFAVERIAPMPNRCLTCHWNPICGGGCAFSRQTQWIDHECLWNRRLFEHISKRLTEFGLARNSLGRHSEKEIQT